MDNFNNDVDCNHDDDETVVRISLMDLPSDLLSTILTSFLDLNSFVNFDSAISDKKKRRELLESMSSLPTSCLDTYQHNARSLWWLALRGLTMNVSRLKYSKDITDIVLSSLCFCYIKCIDLQGCKNITSISCLKRCRLLTELNCNDVYNLYDDSIKAVAGNIIIITLIIVI